VRKRDEKYKIRYSWFMYKISNFSLENGVKRVQLVYAWGLKKVGEFLSREFIVSGY